MKNSKQIYRINLWYRHPNCQLQETISNYDCKEYHIKIRQKRAKIYKRNGTRWDFPVHRQKTWKAKSKSQKQYFKYKQSFAEKNYYNYNIATKNNFLFKLQKLKEKDGIGWYYFNNFDYIKYYQKPYMLYEDNNYYIVAIQLLKEGLITAEYFYDIYKNDEIKIIRCKIRE